MTRSFGFARTVLRTSAGVLVWALHFTVVYAVAALACARGAPHWAPWGIGLTTLCGVAVCLFVLRWQWRERAAFVGGLACGLTALALLAIVWEGIPFLMVTPCT